MAKSKKKYNQGRVVGLVILGLGCLGILVALLLRGTDIALIHPQGQIASQQLKLMIFSTVILLEIAIPTLILLYFFAWKYRETNQKASYDPQGHHGKLVVFGIWAVPTFFMLVLASVMWPAAHKLAPQKAITSDAKPLTVQVVAMRWKWLFIYPEQKIATVNFVQLPVGTPVKFELTADETPMSSFWIPHLGGQIYAMTGHLNGLNLMADTPGDYRGSSAEINGEGFAGMKFTARASSMEAFNQWVQGAKQSTDVLDSTGYAKLLKPSQDNPAKVFSAAEPDLFNSLIKKYSGMHYHGTEQK